MIECIGLALLAGLAGRVTGMANWVLGLFWGGGGGLDNIISSDVGFWGLFFGGLELRGYTWLAGDNGRFNYLICRVGNVKIFLLMIIIYCT